MDMCNETSRFRDFVPRMNTTTIEQDMTLSSRMKVKQSLQDVTKRQQVFATTDVGGSNNGGGSGSNSQSPTSKVATPSSSNDITTINDMSTSSGK